MFFLLYMAAATIPMTCMARSKTGVITLGSGRCTTDSLWAENQASGSMATCRTKCGSDPTCVLFAVKPLPGKFVTCEGFGQFTSCILSTDVPGYTTYRMLTRHPFTTLTPGPVFVERTENFRVGAGRPLWLSGRCVMPYHMVGNVYVYDGTLLSRVVGTDLLLPECAGMCDAMQTCLAFSYGPNEVDVGFRCLLYDSKCVGILRDAMWKDNLLQSFQRTAG